MKSIKWNVGAGVLSAVAVLAMAGCSSTKLDQPAPVETRTPDTNQGANTGSKPAESAVKQVDLGAGSNLPAGLGRVVYFDFDSFVVKDEFRSVVEGNAKYLSANKVKKMLVEGHTDERGSREYNLALGQKDRKSVV